MLQGGDQEALAKPSGSAEEIDVSLCCQPIDHVSLIHIDKSLFPDSVETLYANGVFHCITFSFYPSDKNSDYSGNFFDEQICN